MRRFVVTTCLCVLVGIRIAPIAFSHTRQSSQPSAPEEIQIITESLEELLEKAEKREARAQNTLGVRYEHGDSVPQDYDEAAKWYRRGMLSHNTISGACLKTAGASRKIILKPLNGIVWRVNKGMRKHSIILP